MTKYVCTVCGYIAEGSIPEFCPVSDTAHGQIHADLAALAVEVFAQTLLDLLGNVLGDADDMLGDVGVVLLLNELGCRGLADRAELGEVRFKNKNLS